MTKTLNIDNTGDSERSQLRRKLRARRQQLSTAEQELAASRLFKQLEKHPFFTRPDRLAFYLPADGEISPLPLIQKAMSLGKECYLPVIKPGPEIALVFALYEPGKSTRFNKYNIEEPDLDLAPVIEPAKLGTVFMPLAGFDADCNRLGMGKGYYDRTFSFLLENRLQAPELVGLAHECQRVENLAAESWDVPLDAVFTGSAVYQS